MAYVFKQDGAPQLYNHSYFSLFSVLNFLHFICVDELFIDYKWTRFAWNAHPQACYSFHLSLTFPLDSFFEKFIRLFIIWYNNLLFVNFILLFFIDKKY